MKLQYDYVLGLMNRIRELEEQNRKIVHCRECKYSGDRFCPLAVIEQHSLCFLERSPDWFCADGERSEEDGKIY